MGERVLAGEAFKSSNNDYDWLGPGVRGLEFAQEASRRGRPIKTPCVIGAVIELGYCLDLTTTAGIRLIERAYANLVEHVQAHQSSMPENSKDLLRRYLDCAVLIGAHDAARDLGLPPFDTVKGLFVEGPPIYPTAGFYEKMHTQVCVCNPRCIKAVFRVSKDLLA